MTVVLDRPRTVLSTSQWKQWKSSPKMDSLHRPGVDAARRTLPRVFPSSGRSCQSEVTCRTSPWMFSIAARWTLNLLESLSRRLLRSRSDWSVGMTGLPPFTSSLVSETDDEEILNVLGCRLTYQGQAETSAEAWFSKSLRPRKPEGSLRWTAQDGHLDSHTAPELC